MCNRQSGKGRSANNHASESACSQKLDLEPKWLEPKWLRSWQKKSIPLATEVGAFDPRFADLHMSWVLILFTTLAAERAVWQ